MTSWEDGSRSRAGRTSRKFKPRLPLCFLAYLSSGVLCLPLRAQEPQASQETQQTTPAEAPKPDMPTAKNPDLPSRPQLAKGQHWLAVVGVVGATAILIAADPHDTPYFRRTRSFEGFNDAFSGRITG